MSRKFAVLPDDTKREYLHPSHSDHLASNSRTFGPFVNLSAVRTNFASLSRSMKVIELYMRSYMGTKPPRSLKKQFARNI